MCVSSISHAYFIYIFMYTIASVRPFVLPSVRFWLSLNNKHERRNRREESLPEADQDRSLVRSSHVCSLLHTATSIVCVYIAIVYTNRRSFDHVLIVVFRSIDKLTKSTKRQNVDNSCL